MNDIYTGSDVVGGLVIDDPLADVFFFVSLGLIILFIIGVIKASRNVSDEKTDRERNNSIDSFEDIDDI